MTRDEPFLYPKQHALEGDKPEGFFEVIVIGSHSFGCMLSSRKEKKAVW